MSAQKKAHALKNSYVQALTNPTPGTPGALGTRPNRPGDPGEGRDLTTPPGASLPPHTRNPYVDPSMI